MPAIVYVNIDDGWQGTRDAEGVLHPNAKFPDMKALADYVHARGLKLGIYSSPGPKTCAGYVRQHDQRPFALRHHRAVLARDDDLHRAARRPDHHPFEQCLAGREWP